MLMLIDSANIAEIESLYNNFPYDGVTTNPTILKNANGNPMKILKNIKSLIPKECVLHAQVISLKAEDMVLEAEHMIKEIGDIHIKVPVTKEGIRAISLMKKREMKITATAIYGTMQAVVAAKAGAVFCAPYVNRIDNLGYSGIQVAKDINDIFKTYNFESNVLAASFKNSQQILELCKCGIKSITASSDVLNNLIKSDSTTCANELFINDFHEFCGKNKTMMDF